MTDSTSGPSAASVTARRILDCREQLEEELRHEIEATYAGACDLDRDETNQLFQGDVQGTRWTREEICKEVVQKALIDAAAPRLAEGIEDRTTVSQCVLAAILVEFAADILMRELGTDGFAAVLRDTLEMVHDDRFESYVMGSLVHRHAPNRAVKWKYRHFDDLDL